jgi:hypothetical protein
MSNDMQNICREIDTVTVKGSIKPMRLFTIDLSFEDLRPENDIMVNKKLKLKKKIRDDLRQ